MIKGFNTIFGEMRQGRSHDEMSAQLNELVDAVVATRKKGTLTLTITVQPATKAAGNAILVTDEIKLKKPEFERGSDIFFATPDNNLQKQDPSQRTLPLESVPSKASPDLSELQEIVPGQRTYEN